MAAHGSRARERADRLNESPSQKEGKFVGSTPITSSMGVPQ